MTEKIDFKETPLTYLEEDKKFARKGLTVLLLTILDAILILWVNNWQFTPLIFAAGINILFAFKKFVNLKIRKRITAIILGIIQFVILVISAGGELTLQAFLLLSKVIVLTENLETTETEIPITG